MLQESLRNKPVFIDSLTIEIVNFLHRHTHRPAMGNQNESIGLLLAGTVDIVSARTRFTAGPGDLIYIPRDLAYTSTWAGSPQISFYSLRFTFARPRLAPETGAVPSRYHLQKINGHDDAIPALFEQLHSECNKKDGSPGQALSVFYQLFTQLTPMLRQEEPETGNSPVQRAVRALETNPALDFSVPQLARFCGMSESNFYLLFKKQTGCSPVTYRNRVRVRQAIELLAGSQASVEWISQTLNFSSPAYFRRVFKSFTGVTPHEIRLREHGL
ncbi:MAG: AraC family transcriptional regulator [Clostridiaceae bacterium]|nr:AraC family transcriptional regulator [Clostridiaceae bacterium]